MANKHRKVWKVVSRKMNSGKQTWPKASNDIIWHWQSSSWSLTVSAFSFLIFLTWSFNYPKGTISKPN
jgi:hypothetical protein